MVKIPKWNSTVISVTRLKKLRKLLTDGWENDAGDTAAAHSMRVSELRWLLDRALREVAK